MAQGRAAGSLGRQELSWLGTALPWLLLARAARARAHSLPLAAASLAFDLWCSYLTETIRKSSRVAPWIAASRKK